MIHQFFWVFSIRTYHWDSGTTRCTVPPTPTERAPLWFSPVLHQYTVITQQTITPSPSGYSVPVWREMSTREKNNMFFPRPRENCFVLFIFIEAALRARRNMCPLLGLCRGYLFFCILPLYCIPIQTRTCSSLNSFSTNYVKICISHYLRGEKGRSAPGGMAWKKRDRAEVAWWKIDK